VGLLKLVLVDTRAIGEKWYIRTQSRNEDERMVILVRVRDFVDARDSGSIQRGIEVNISLRSRVPGIAPR
jgi:hypothetical protein